MDALASAHFEVRRAATIPADLADDQVVLLNDWNLEAIPATRKTTFEKFVKSGGVLAVIGGQHKDFVKARAGQDALERTLPARFVPPETALGTCFVLVLQKSSSMDGKKMELARLAALEVMENLRRNDMIGLLTFADTSEWTVPIHKTTDRDSIDDVIKGVSAGGGTRIAPALDEAFLRILAVDAMSKHFVLLTDGRAENRDILALAPQAATRHVTISTVALGDRENRDDLARVAQWTGGGSYFINNPWDLEPTVLRDTIANTDPEAYEHASGQFVPKPRARLVTSTEPGDPRLIRWQYGLGRAEILTSEAIRGTKSSAPLKIGEFWENAVSHLPKGAPKVEATAEYDKTNDEFVINYHFGRHMPVPAMAAEIFVFGPHGFGTPLSIEKVSETVLRARVRCNHTSGLFRVLPLGESSAFPQVRLYRNDQELDDAGPNAPLLQSVSEVTGGRFNPGLRSIFDPNGHIAVRKVQLWPELVAVALVLFLVNWIPRRRRDRFDRVRSAFTRTGATPQPRAV